VISAQPGPEPGCLWPEPTVAQVVARLAAAPARAGTRILAIDGPSAAGKTTLAAAVQWAFPQLGPVPVVHLDDLYPGWDGLADGVARLLEWVLRPLASGRQARYRRYDWDRRDYAEWHELPQTPVLVLEGAGSGSTACLPYLSLLVWVTAPEPIRFARAMARDGETYRPYWERWARQEERHFAVHNPIADAALVLDAQTGGVL
jgi:uridine kinase